MHVTAIIAAAGRGQRFGGAEPKQLLMVGGRPILERSVTAFASHPAVSAIVVALPQALVDDPPEYLRPAGAALHGKPVRLVAGGARRQDSVANAFHAAGVATEIIVIHDAARPFATADLIARTIAAAAESGAAVAAVQSRDTVKLAADGRADAGRYVRETIARETIYLAQTPQAFQRDVLRRALEAGARSTVDATDEAALAELAGLPVRIVDGEASNIKITTADDMTIAEAIAANPQSNPQSNPHSNPHSNPQSNPHSNPQSNPQSAIRNPQFVGSGYDLHRLIEGRPLVLGGVTIPSDRGALGHSDADVVCHALTDAILGAAALGDIGRHFPDTDARWKDANSVDLLRRAVELVAGQGLMVGNVDVTVILETPKIRGHVDAMRASVAAALGIDVARVSIKGKTNEGVDAVGRGEAIAAHAIVLIRAI